MLRALLNFMQVHRIPYLHLATLGNHNIQVRHVLAAISSLGVLHLPDNIHAVNNLTKHDVLTVQERGRDGGDEELRAVGVGAGVLLVKLCQF